MQNKTLREWSEDYFNYRESYGQSTSDRVRVNTFINWTERAFPDELYPMQEMFDMWGVKRETEHGNSHPTRVNTINRFMKFMNDRGCSFIPIEGLEEPYQRVYRIITEEEFANACRAADELPTLGLKNQHGHDNQFYLRYMLRALEMPVIIRLIYSSGIRPPEVRLLDRKDVDLENGILYIRKGKGYNEHIVAMHPDMTHLMQMYDKKMEQLFPGRVPFFPNEKGKYITRDTLLYNWRIVCDKYNTSTAPVDGKLGVEIYSLRHLNITKNIEAISQDGYDTDIRLVALSQSAGHANVDVTTKNYFHITQHAANVIEEKLDDTMDMIIPDVDE